MLTHPPALFWVEVRTTALIPPDAESSDRGGPVAESYTGDAYCVKCKEKRDFTGEVKVSESGRRMAQGICPVCGTKLNRILGKA
jgi:hypothetical protein